MRVHRPLIRGAFSQRPAPSPAFLPLGEGGCRRGTCLFHSCSPRGIARCGASLVHPRCVLSMSGSIPGLTPAGRRPLAARASSASCPLPERDRGVRVHRPFIRGVFSQCPAPFPTASRRRGAESTGLVCVSPASREGSRGEGSSPAHPRCVLSASGSIPGLTPAGRRPLAARASSVSCPFPERNRSVRGPRPLIRGAFSQCPAPSPAFFPPGEGRWRRGPRLFHARSPSGVAR
ncbi:hypothetical protein C7443_10474 [Plasticicumulans acidivorans]|uniref:Uncharacterized protein n=1 Tax=Plasticicumulans acidivorans TaxID=886464 RepID=A0A317N0Q3_9GAMM|nr:hypothetical protein C7443_10474 [Plasticicumulans acidivorans]